MRWVGRIYRSAPLWAWIVIVVCVIILVVGLVISADRTTPPPSAAVSTTPAPTTARAGGPTATSSFVTDARATTRQPKTILLLGDSTGSSPTGWVAAVGRTISSSLDRPVSASYWNPATAEYGPAVPLGTGSSAAVGFWNGSAPGEDARYAVENLSALTTTPEGDPITPDLVLVNFGLTEDPSRSLAGQIQPLLAAIGKKFPDAGIAAITQNPPRGADNTTQVREYASAMNAAGIQVIDVHSAFPSTPARRTALMSDDITPNAAGHKLWTTTVLAAFELPTHP